MTDAQTPDDWPFPGDPSVHVGTRHHLVPRSYLDRFALNERIVVIDRHTGERRSSNIKETATEKDFYTFINTSGELDGHLELLLGKIEDPGIQAIRKVVSPYVQEPNDADRADICLLLAFQIVRGRATRRRIELTADLMTRIQAHGIEDENIARSVLNHRGIAEPSADDIAGLIDFSTHLDEYEIKPDPNDHINHIGPGARAIFPYLLSRKWVLFEFAKASLLTSDEPVALYSSRAHERSESLGVKNAEEIIFPLDPKRLLVLHQADWLPQFSRETGTSEVANIANLIVANNAYNHIFLHPSCDVEVPELTEAGPLFLVTEDASPVLSRYNQPPTERRTRRRKPEDGSRPKRTPRSR